MSDAKPKRTVRDPGRRDASSDETLPAAAAPASVPDTPPTAEVVLTQPTAVAEPTPVIVSASAKPPADSVGDSWSAFAEAQAVLARGFEEFVAEVTGRAGSGIAAAADAAVALIGVRTLSEAIEINATLARRTLDAMIEGSTKLSEIGVKAVSEASRPVLSRFAAPPG